jgi:hypothetical protein
LGQNIKISHYATENHGKRGRAGEIATTYLIKANSHNTFRGGMLKMGGDSGKFLIPG